MKVAKRQRAYKGLFISVQTPYGYKVDPMDKNHLVIDEEVSDVVKEVYEIMGKVKLSEIDRSYIKNFLKYDDKNISKNWVINAAVANICAFFAAVYFLEYKLVWGIIFSLVNMGVLSSLIYFLKKVEHDKKGIYFYYGIYTSMWSVSFSTLSYGLLKREFGKDNYWIIVGFIGFSIVMIIMTFFIYKKRLVLIVTEIAGILKSAHHL